MWKHQLHDTKKYESNSSSIFVPDRTNALPKAIKSRSDENKINRRSNNRFPDVNNQDDICNADKPPQ